MPPKISEIVARSVPGLSQDELRSVVHMIGRAPHLSELGRHNPGALEETLQENLGDLRRQIDTRSLPARIRGLHPDLGEEAFALARRNLLAQVRGRQAEFGQNRGRGWVYDYRLDPLVHAAVDAARREIADKPRRLPLATWMNTYIVPAPEGSWYPANPAELEVYLRAARRNDHGFFTLPLPYPVYEDLCRRLCGTAGRPPTRSIPKALVDTFPNLPPVVHADNAAEAAAYILDRLRLAPADPSTPDAPDGALDLAVHTFREDMRRVLGLKRRLLGLGEGAPEGKIACIWALERDTLPVAADEAEIGPLLRG